MMRPKATFWQVARRRTRAVPRETIFASVCLPRSSSQTSPTSSVITKARSKHDLTNTTKVDRVCVRLASGAVARAARAAASLRELLLTAASAVAMGRGLAAEQLPVGDAVKAAARTLSRARRTSTDLTAKIYLDEVTAGLLDARFNVQSEGARCVLYSSGDKVDATRGRSWANPRRVSVVSAKVRRWSRHTTK